jgi:GDPmannose 4,6-dehydratase
MKALITGITGQDGSYLAELLLARNYEVHGVKRRGSNLNTQRVDHLFNHKNFHLHYGDMTDSTNLNSLVNSIEPNEVYNLAAQSHVAVSFEMPEYTANADAVGTLRLLEACKGKDIRFYQASTSEMFGASPPPQSETTPFYPRSPYGAAKLYAHWMVVNYREAYDMYACSGILFNHESPRRGETFVTRKIVQGLVNIKKGKQSCLYLGYLHAKRDWGHAKDYAFAMYLMLQQDFPADYVIATGQQHSVKDFVNAVADKLGMELEWHEREVLESEYATWNGKIVVDTHSKYYRPTEVDSLCGDATKAQRELGWKPTIGFDQLVSEMVEAELG